MRFNKKGDLALSTNAIVVLIVAVIILGLIITFITQGFGAVSDQLKSKFSQVEPPQSPNSADPITQNGVTVLAPGAEFNWKLLVYNPTAAPLAAVTPMLKCQDASVLDTSVTNGLNSFPQATIAPRDVSKIFEVTGKIARNAPAGKQLCQISAAAGTLTTDIVIEVKS